MKMAIASALEYEDDKLILVWKVVLGLRPLVYIQELPIKTWSLSLFFKDLSV